MTVMAKSNSEIIQGDCLDVLAGMPERSVHCVVTSPPYWGLRDYGTAKWDGGDDGCDHSRSARLTDRRQKDGAWTTGGTVEHGPPPDNRGTCGKCGARRIDNQLGLEKTPDEYLAKMVEVFRAVRRVLRDDGTLWLNMGDRYNGVGGPGKQDGGPIGPTAAVAIKGTAGTHVSGLKPKDLCGMPWRLALALQADGWTLRSDIIWHKPNPMPESCTDRPTKSHEHMFLLTKRPTYFYDADAIREPHTSGTNTCEPPKGDFNSRRAAGEKTDGKWTRTKCPSRMPGYFGHPLGRNLRDVWTIPTESFKAAHFATFPRKLVEPCIKAGTSEKGCCPECGAPWVRVVTKTQIKRARPNDYVKRTGEPGTGNVCANSVAGVSVRTIGWDPVCTCFDGIDTSVADRSPIPCTVLDIFAGSGTSGVVATQLGRRFIGIELNGAYAEMARRRIENPEPEPEIPDVEGQSTMEFAR